MITRREAIKTGVLAGLAVVFKKWLPKSYTWEPTPFTEVIVDPYCPPGTAYLFSNRDLLIERVTQIYNTSPIITGLLSDVTVEYAPEL